MLSSFENLCKKVSDFLCCSDDELLEDAFGLTRFNWFRASSHCTDIEVCE